MSDKEGFNNVGRLNKHVSYLIYLQLHANRRCLYRRPDKLISSQMADSKPTMGIVVL